jgi:hypothetical protein
MEPHLRAAFRTSFTEAQCEAWGQRSEAAKVLGEATRWLVPLQAALEKGDVAGYSSRRLAFLAELLVELEDEIAATTEPAEGAPPHPGHPGARQSAFTYARGVRRELIDRLGLIAAGRDELQALVAARDEGDKSPDTLRDSLAGLIELASRWRRDPAMELLADDADLTTARLGGAYNALEALARADVVLGEGAGREGDAGSVNRVEGRVLRELDLAQRAFARARAAGLPVPPLVPGPMLRKGFG